MRDTELYGTILGLTPPWTVSSVTVDVPGQQVLVKVKAPGGSFSCPECQRDCPGYDRRARRWRHLDTCQLRTVIEAEVPRIQCPAHGVRQIRVPWAEPGSQFTLLFDRLAIELLRACSVKDAARLLRISWDEAWGVVTRAVARGQARKAATAPTRLGVDEKAIAKGHRYLTLVVDLDRACVEYLAEERTQAALEGFFARLTTDQRTAIEVVAMDMWAPFIQAVRAAVPEADQKIVFDRFHIMQHMTQAVDRVRRREHRTWAGPEASPLTGTKYLWLYTADHLPDRYVEQFAALCQQELQTGRAWAIKETLRRLWTYATPGGARRFFARWFWWATHSQLQPVRQVAHLLKRHLAQIVTYARHRVTNAVTEGLNSKIQQIKKVACGFRNVEHFKTAIYFRCGGLDLYPH